MMLFSNIVAEVIPLYIGVPLALLVLLLCAFVAILIVRELKRGNVSEAPAPKPVEASKPQITASPITLPASSGAEEDFAPVQVVPVAMVEKLADSIGKAVVAAVKANGGGAVVNGAPAAKGEPKQVFEPLPMAPMPQPKSKTAAAPAPASGIDPKTVAVIAAAAATVLQGKKHRVVSIRKMRVSSGSAWTEQGRVAIHEKRHLGRN